MTARDEVWDTVLRKLTTAEETGFKISDLGFEKSQRHTVRRVLREMEDLSWLERENDRSHIWYPGESAKQFLNLAKSSDKIEPDT